MWNWCEDGSNIRGTVELTPDGKIIWNGGAPQGSWKIDGDILTMNCNNVIQKLKISHSGGEAQLFVPKKNPASKMVKQGIVSLSVNSGYLIPLEKITSQLSVVHELFNGLLCI